MVIPMESIHTIHLYDGSNMRNFVLRGIEMARLMICTLASVAAVAIASPAAARDARKDPEQIGN